jgi:hypothetical protein
MAQVAAIRLDFIGVSPLKKVVGANGSRVTGSTVEQRMSQWAETTAACTAARRARAPE